MTATLFLGGVDGFVGAEDLPTPEFRHVFEFRVEFGDQSYFFCARPALELGLAGDGFENGIEGFDIDEAGASVFVGEVGAGTGAVLNDSGVEATGDAEVQGSGRAAEDVDVAALGHGRRVQEPGRQGEKGSSRWGGMDRFGILRLRSE
jgi:hypothetical protein